MQSSRQSLNCWRRWRSSCCCCRCASLSPLLCAGGAFMRLVPLMTKPPAVAIAMIAYNCCPSSLERGTSPSGVHDRWGQSLFFCFLSSQLG
eukprot:SAG31_NODE_1897_length_6964_cov_2.677349_8_plen_91_part_00